MIILFTLFKFIKQMFPNICASAKCNWSIQLQKNLTGEARKINWKYICICSRGGLVQKDQRSASKEVWLKSEQIMWLQGPAVRWMLWTRQRAIFAIFNNRTFKVPQRFDPVQFSSTCTQILYMHGCTMERIEGRRTIILENNLFDKIVWLGGY